MSSPIDSSERLLRNIHPDDFDNGKINSSVFNPSESHDFKLSVDRNGMTTPSDTYNRHLGAGLESIGVCGVHARDFLLESIACAPDPIIGNPAHAFADFSAHGLSQRRKKARRLATTALNYGFDYSP